MLLCDCLVDLLFWCWVDVVEDEVIGEVDLVCMCVFLEELGWEGEGVGERSDFVMFFLEFIDSG